MIKKVLRAIVLVRPAQGYAVVDNYTLGQVLYKDGNQVVIKDYGRLQFNTLYDLPDGTTLGEIKVLSYYGNPHELDCNPQIPEEKPAEPKPFWSFILELFEPELPPEEAKYLRDVTKPLSDPCSKVNVGDYLIARHSHFGAGMSLLKPDQDDVELIEHLKSLVPENPSYDDPFSPDGRSFSLTLTNNDPDNPVTIKGSLVFEGYSSKWYQDGNASRRGTPSEVRRFDDHIVIETRMLHPVTGEVMDWYVSFDGKQVVDVKVEWWAVSGKVLLVN